MSMAFITKHREMANGQKYKQPIQLFQSNSKRVFMLFPKQCYPYKVVGSHLVNERCGEGSMGEYKGHQTQYCVNQAI